MNFDPNVHVPGLWRYAKCNFGLVQSNLNARDGTVSARDEAGDAWPNDGAPLWRVSWKEHATEMAARGEDAVKEAAQLRAENAWLEVDNARMAQAIQRSAMEMGSSDEWSDCANMVADFGQQFLTLRAESARLTEALREAEKALEPFAKFSPKAEQFVETRARAANDVSAIMPPTKDFRLSDFRRTVAAREAISVALAGTGERETPSKDAGHE